MQRREGRVGVKKSRSQVKEVKLKSREEGTREDFPKEP
jgi:hypothetical protein